MPLPLGLDVVVVGVPVLVVLGFEVVLEGPLDVVPEGVVVGLVVVVVLAFTVVVVVLALVDVGPEPGTH